MPPDVRPPAADPGRIDQFDGLRAFAFLAVFLHHALGVRLLWMGVDLFFVLSGFLITRNLLVLRDRATLASAFKVFYYRRALRILPPYYLAVTAILLLQGGVPHAGWYYGFASNVHDALGEVDEGPLNTMWSIAVEEQFYLVWPWLVLLAPRRWLIGLFAAVIVTAPLCRLLSAPLGLNAVYRLTWCRMDLLALGAALAWIDLRDPAWIPRHRRHFAALSVVAVGAFGALAWSFASFRTHLNLPLFNVVGFSLSCAFFTGILAFVRGTDSAAVLGILRHPVLQYVGKVSYMAYLVHVLCIDLANGWVSGPASAGVALGLTLLVATVSWYAFEAPLSRWRSAVGPVVPVEGSR